MENITRMRRTPREWTDLITTMTTLGASATREQLATIKQYLVRYHGAVNVNTATAAELSAVLGLSSRDAAAIVEYRKAHGRFADAAALARVRGIDTARAVGQPDALRFDRP